MADSSSLNTDYDTDKIIYLETATATIDINGAASVTLGSGGTVTYNGFGDAFFDHGLPYRPLLLYTWSTSSDFSVSYTHESRYESLTTSVYTRDDTAVTLTGIRPGGGISTVYFRIYGLQRPGATGELSPPNESLYTNHLKYSTDLNYMKIVTEGVTGTISPGSSETISHSLGYRPRVVAWVKDPSTGYEFYHNLSITDLSAGGITVTVKPTTTDVVIANPAVSLSSSIVTYKVYLDD